MPITLYDASVRSFLQTLEGVAVFMDRGLSHCTDNGIDPDEIVETSLFPDMWPFRRQIWAVVQHSLGAIEGIKHGQVSPAQEIPPLDYAGLQRLVAEAIEGLRALTPEEVNALEGRDVVFSVPHVQLPFIAEDFLLSLALPNFHFHATTAYDILRMKGAPLGKRDYMGQMRLKT